MFLYIAHCISSPGLILLFGLLFKIQRCVMEAEIEIAGEGSYLLVIASQESTCLVVPICL